MASRIRILFEFDDIAEIVAHELDLPFESDQVRDEADKILDTIGQQVEQDGREWIEERLRETIRIVHGVNRLSSIPKAPQVEPEW